MKSSPFFSVIIPTFNRAGLLEKAIASVVSQTYTSWELIVVDDGSTDNTAEVVKHFDDERVRYVYQTNAERSAARNNGIDHANGSYICFLDSDDYYLPGRLEGLHNELIKRNCPVEMFFTWLMIDIGGKVVEEEKHYKPVSNVFDNIALNIIHSQQACISKPILQEFKYSKQFRIGEDMELWLRIARKYPVTYLDNQFTIVVVEHDERSVNVMRNNTGKDQLRLYRHVFAAGHSGKDITENVKRFMTAGAYHAIARYNIHRGNRWASVKAISNAMTSDMGSAWFKFRANIFLKLITFAPLDKVKALIDYN